MMQTTLREQIAQIIEEQRSAEPLEVADRILGLFQQTHLDPADYDPKERAETIAAVREALMPNRTWRSWSQIEKEDREKYGIPE